MSYGYDDASRRTSITYPGGSNQATYAYDNANRLASVTDWNMATIDYAYDDAGRMTTATLPSGTDIISTYSYDPSAGRTDRLTGITHVKGGSTILPRKDSVAYTLDQVGNRTQSFPGRIAGNTTTYAYDDNDRITSVTPPSPASVINYTWDDNEDLTNRGSDTFSWDYEDRLVSATVNSVTTTFAYRGDGLRDSRAVSGGATTTFTWDVAAGLPVVLDDGNQYLYGVGLTAQKQSGSWYYYLADGLGSTLAVVNDSGTVQDSYTYDVYGTPTKTGSLANEFDFAGQQTDGTGLQYLRARYYDPATGTFLSRDLKASNVGCTLHPYGYGTASPVRLTDPSGQVPIDGGEGGRSDCAGLWTKIVNTVNAIWDAAETWFGNDYGTWDTGFGADPGARMTLESRARHYQEFDRLQTAYDRQIDDYYAKGASKQKNPCPPPGGGAWGRATNAFLLLKGEYMRGKTLDEAARHWQGSTSNPSGGWNFHWPKPPDLGNTAP